MALAGALAARSMQGQPRGRNDSSSPLAAAVTLFEDGWQGGDIPGVFNDEEELERDLKKLMQIADSIWGEFEPPQVAIDGVEPPPRSQTITGAGGPGGVEGSSIAPITQLSSRTTTPMEGDGAEVAGESQGASTVGVGRGTPPGQQATFATIGTQEMEMETFNAEPEGGLHRPQPRRALPGDTSAAMSLTSPGSPGEGEEEVVAGGGEAPRPRAPVLHASGPNEELITEPDPYCWGNFRDETECKAKTVATMEDPTYSTLSWYISIVIFAFIIISTITIVIETLPDFDNDDARRDFFIVEAIAITVFTLEYGIRWWAHEDKYKYMTEPLNVIDLVAILPFYIDLILIISDAGDGPFLKLMKLFRLIRVLRILKLSRYNDNIALCATAMVDSQDTLGLMMFMLSIVVVVFSAFVFFFEQGEKMNLPVGGIWINNTNYGGSWNNETYFVENSICTASRQALADNAHVCYQRTKFVSIPGSAWWTLVTMMTVGYGDMIPITIPGKLIATVAMLSSIVILALPISVIGANFSRAWMDRKELNERYMDGHEVSIVYKNLIHNLSEHNSILEDMLSSDTNKMHNLKEQLAEARDEYQRLREAQGSAVDPRAEGLPPALEPSEQLALMLARIDKTEADIQKALEVTKTIQNVEFDQAIVEAIQKCSAMETVVAEQCMLSAKIEDRERHVMGRLLSVPVGP